MTKKYIYFVSYFHLGGNGNAIISVNSKIDCAQYIRDMEKTISEGDNLSGVIIINFILLREEESE